MPANLRTALADILGMATIPFPQKEHVTPYLFGVGLLPVCALFAFGDHTVDPHPLWVLAHAWDLIVHEAGHVVFRWFGTTVHAAGGSLLQLLLPALFVYQGVYWGNRIGTQLALLLLGQNFVDVSIYAADAQTRALPLLGGDRVFHDWHVILSNLGLLEATPVIAGVLYALAFVAWAVMLLVPRWIL